MLAQHLPFNRNASSSGSIGFTDRLRACDVWSLLRFTGRAYAASPPCACWAVTKVSAR